MIRVVSGHNDRVKFVLRTQLIFPSFGVTYALWTKQIKPHIDVATSKVCLRAKLRNITCRRVNVHEIIVEYEMELTKWKKTDENMIIVNSRPSVISTNFIGINYVNREIALANNNDEKNTTTGLLKNVLSTNNLRKFEDTIYENNNEFNIFDFWQTEQFWWNNVIESRTDWLYETAAKSENEENYIRKKCVAKTTRLLNHLARLYMQNLRVLDITKIVGIFQNMAKEKIDFLKRVFIEPTNGSLFASYISTIYMHNKQQHGLNTKHAAANSKQTMSEETDENEHTQNDEKNNKGEIERKRRRPLQSERPFDAKIFLEISASCDKREIFELMISLSKKRHAGPDCDCETCRALRGFANAWRYYDCTQRWWLRGEYNRKFYTKICTTLEDSVKSDKTRIIFTSYKNEFTIRENFISNFLNYYAFYENNEQPLTIGQCSGKMRQIVSIILIFAHINWLLIARAMKNGVPFNSISLNQQSLYKSLDNTLYAIFSENSINRIRKETEQKTLTANSPYVNRGLGAVPNCGINAFSTSVRHTILYEDDDDDGVVIRAT